MFSIFKDIRMSHDNRQPVNICLFDCNNTSISEFALIIYYQRSSSYRYLFIGFPRLQILVPFTRCLSTFFDFQTRKPAVKMSYTNGTSNRGGGYEQIGPGEPLLHTGPSSDDSKVFSCKSLLFCLI